MLTVCFSKVYHTHLLNSIAACVKFKKKYGTAEQTDCPVFPLSHGALFTFIYDHSDRHNAAADNKQRYPQQDVAAVADCAAFVFADMPLPVFSPKLPLASLSISHRYSEIRGGTGIFRKQNSRPKGRLIYNTFYFFLFADSMFIST